MRSQRQMRTKPLITLNMGRDISVQYVRAWGADRVGAWPDRSGDRLPREGGGKIARSSEPVDPCPHSSLKNHLG